MTELWKDIEGYEGLYQVSNTEKIKSLGRFEDGHSRNGVKNASYYRKEKILKQQTNIDGYLIVVLYKNKKPKQHFTHDLVAKAFIPNPNGYQFIDHIDGNRQNNSVDNLRWCTSKENANNPITKKRMIETQTKLNGKKIVCIKDGEVVHTFNSVNEAGRYFKAKKGTAISNCLNGKSKTAYGYIWEYKKDAS